jgi:hypothetical protein
LKSVELGSEGGISLGALLRKGSQVRAGPWLDAERGGEVREPEGGLVSGHPGQRQPRWDLSLPSPLAGVDSEFHCDIPLNHLERGSNGRPLGARNLRASAAGSNQPLDLPAKAFTAQEDLGPQLLPRRVSRSLPLGDELSIARPRQLLASELRQCPVHLQPTGNLPQPGSRAVVAPPPLASRLYKPGPDRIENNVPGQLQKMRLLLDQDGLEPSLHQVTVSLVSPVEPLRVDAVEVSHAPGQVGFGRFDQQMEVVAHQNEAMQSPFEALDSLSEDVQEAFPVSFVSKDVSPFVPPTRDMPDSTGMLQPQRSRHDRSSHYHRCDPSSLL